MEEEEKESIEKNSKSLEIAQLHVDLPRGLKLEASELFKKYDLNLTEIIIEALNKKVNELKGNSWVCGKCLQNSNRLAFAPIPFKEPVFLLLCPDCFKECVEIYKEDLRDSQNLIASSVYFSEQSYFINSLKRMFSYYPLRYHYENGWFGYQTLQEFNKDFIEFSEQEIKKEVENNG